MYEGELVDVLLLDFQAAFKHVPCVRWLEHVELGRVRGELATAKVRSNAGRNVNR